MIKRAGTLSLLTLVAACALEDVWTGSACVRDTACVQQKDAEAPGELDGALSEDTGIVNPTRPGCPSGRFLMDVKSTYRASPSGLCFLVGPTEALNTDGMWYLAMTSTMRDAQHADIEGCIRVPGQGEDAGASDIDWRAAISGRMDCATGELTAEIRATYNVVSICTLGVFATRYYSKGPLHGFYDRTADYFSDGTLTMSEPPVILGDPPGGEGTWSGGRALGAYDEDLSPFHCLGELVFPEEMFVRDAGVTDAGVP